MSESIKIRARYVREHFNPRARAHVPAYWTPDVDGLGKVTVWPCKTEQEAIELGIELVENGLAEV